MDRQLVSPLKSSCRWRGLHDAEKDGQPGGVSSLPALSPGTLGVTLSQSGAMAVKNNGYKAIFSRLIVVIWEDGVNGMELYEG